MRERFVIKFDDKDDIVGYRWYNPDVKPIGTIQNHTYLHSIVLHSIFHQDSPHFRHHFGGNCGFADFLKYYYELQRNNRLSL